MPVGVWRLCPLGGAGRQVRVEFGCGQGCVVGYSRSPIRAPVLSLVVLPGVATILLLIVLALPFALGFASFLLALVVGVW